MELNKEKLLKYDKQYYHNKKQEKINELLELERKKEEKKAYQKKYYEDNKEKIKLYKQQYYKKIDKDI